MFVLPGCNLKIATLKGAQMCAREDNIQKVKLGKFKSGLLYDSNLRSFCKSAIYNMML